MNKYDCYLAAPFFTPEQIQRLELIETELRKRFIVYSPSKELFLTPGEFHSKEKRQQVLKANFDAIKNSKFVVCITDDRDLGSLLEAGYAIAKRKPIIYVALTLGDKPFNLMLSETATAVAKTIEDFIKILDLIKRCGIKSKHLDYYKYSGKIE
ncbi:MAG: nucleoside 2-deoxyribosyltransferase [Candidatus Omnitrophica bacterium]|nr:nucleoside 2-deoxyribosyltransferase [Candidatus Omnitrophota bacterium]